MPGLEGRVALITGASRGIGAATAVMLAEQGADVAINYNSSRDAAESVAAQVRSLGRRAGVYQADIRSFDDCQRMVDAALGDFSKIDILVNNAGIGYETFGTPLVTEIEPADLQQFLNFNTFGSFYMCKLVVPQMRALPRGDVIMVSSFSAQALRVRMGAYSVSKAGMEALAQVLAKEEREHGIRVNIVAPGLVDTAMGDGFLDSRGADKKTYEKDAPFGFICQPEDVAGAILYLVSESGRYVTGQRITVNGGAF
ncbi:MAG TPA: SDR family oxidoreductase [Dehalococcoidia bacterium]|nr:SDR family oxidoreductase [Dehalococcoidia bacterium]